MIVYVVNEVERDPWQEPDAEPARSHILAIYSNETAARTHLASRGIRPPGVWLRIQAWEVDAPCTERAAGGGE